MRLFESAGFAEPLSKQIADAVKKVAVGIRTAVAVNDQHNRIEQIVSNAAGHFETSIFIVGGWDWRRPDGGLYQRRDADLSYMAPHLINQCRSILSVWLRTERKPSDCWIEFGNEVDGSYWKNNLGQFFNVAMACYRKVREASEHSPFITGSTMNFNKGRLWNRNGYDVMKELCAFGWPRDTLQGLHPYRQEGRGWPSFKSDAKALAALSKLLRGRRVAVTEMGWRSNEQHTDAKIAAMTREEIDMWRRFGSACFVHYQIVDAPRPNNRGEGAFGAFSAHVDGLAPKPVAEVLEAQRGLA